MCLQGRATKEILYKEDGIGTGGEAGGPGFILAAYNTGRILNFYCYFFWNTEFRHLPASLKVSQDVKLFCHLQGMV